jgi:hypothetical protein
LMWLKDYQGASDAMKQIIDGNVFRLVPINQFRALFDTGESQEMIFQMYYNANKGEFSDYYGHIMTYYLTNPYTDRGNLSLAVPKSKILEIYPDYAREELQSSFRVLISLLAPVSCVLYFLIHYRMENVKLCLQSSERLKTVLTT